MTNSETLLTDEQAVAEAAGLRYSSDSEPGYQRRRCGTGFSYIGADGRVASPKDKLRFVGLSIPPAWKDVWINSDPAGHLQVTGRDDRDRKQYLYHPHWHEARDELKFARLGDFGKRLGDIRRCVASDLELNGLPKRRVLAAVVALIDTTLIRIGNERYAADNETFGATTLEPRHVRSTKSGYLLEFTAKSGVERSIEVASPLVCEVIGLCLERGQRQVFCYDGSGAASIDVSSLDVNGYLESLAGVTAKTFRTWGATSIAVQHLANRQRSQLLDHSFLAAIDASAEALGNTRAVCRSSYIAPLVLDAAATDHLDMTWASCRTGRWRTRSENTTMQLLR